MAEVTLYPCSAAWGVRCSETGCKNSVIRLQPKGKLKNKICLSKIFKTTHWRVDWSDTPINRTSFVCAFQNRWKCMMIMLWLRGKIMVWVKMTSLTFRNHCHHDNNDNHVLWESYAHGLKTRTKKQDTNSCLLWWSEIFCWPINPPRPLQYTDLVAL